MPWVELSAGEIEYEDTGGPGPVMVFVHGLIMDGSQWRHVVADLRRDHRCVLPTLPLGAHRQPMRAGADLSMRGIVEILREFIERLDLKHARRHRLDPLVVECQPLDEGTTASRLARALEITAA